MNNLNQEEKDLLNSVENNEWQSINEVDEAKSIYQTYAQEYLQRSIKVVLSTEDEQKLSQLANQLGKSKSGLMEEILHKYLRGLLVDKTA